MNKTLIPTYHYHRSSPKTLKVYIKELQGILKDVYKNPYMYLKDNRIISYDRITFGKEKIPETVATVARSFISNHNVFIAIKAFNKPVKGFQLTEYKRQRSVIISKDSIKVLTDKGYAIDERF